MEPRTDVANQIFDGVELCLGSPQLGLVNSNFFMCAVQEVFNASLVLCEQVTFGPDLLEEFLLLLVRRLVVVSHVTNL